jgi:murein DD-endopeptidase MepM/ murein hydrolase activator NlpD
MHCLSHPLRFGRQVFAAFFLLSLHLATANAQPSPGFRVVTWSPLSLTSGSPVLFRVQLNQPAKELQGSWLGHALTFTRTKQGDGWYTLAGIGVEQAPGTYPLDLTATSTSGQSIHDVEQLKVLPGSYKTTTLHVAENYVQPDAATQKRIAADSAVKAAAYARMIEHPLWKGDFRSPVPFKATDSFGTRRTFNGELASIHRGTDFHAPAGTPVLAANDGEVIVAQPMFYEGNLVIINHGLQFDTQYMHLSKIEVKVGQRVLKGQRIGLSGATGRVTGPHLHFGVRWQDMYIDPVLLLHMSLPAQ